MIFHGCLDYSWLEQDVIKTRHRQSQTEYQNNFPHPQVIAAQITWEQRAPEILPQVGGSHTRSIQNPCLLMIIGVYTTYWALLYRKRRWVKTVICRRVLNVWADLGCE